LTAQVSSEVQNEALRIAKGTQKKAQSKEQTKLIAQGIEKGISEYKKQQKAKARERDKQRKKIVAAKTKMPENEILASSIIDKKSTTASAKVLVILPWLLLIVSWGYFLFV
jgi:hypothetical protein